MRLRNGLLSALMLTLLLVVLPASLGVAADDPATVFQRFIDARNRYDVEGTLALLTDDIRFVGGPQCAPAAPCIGAAAVRTDLENTFISVHAQATVVDVPQVTGTTVRAQFEVRADQIRAAGVERIVNTVTVEVRDGKIASFIAVPDMSDAQTAQFLTYARAQQGPPTAPPWTGGGGEASFIFIREMKSCCVLPVYLSR